MPLPGDPLLYFLRNPPVQPSRPGSLHVLVSYTPSEIMGTFAIIICVCLNAILGHSFLPHLKTVRYSGVHKGRLFWCIDTILRLDPSDEVKCTKISTIESKNGTPCGSRGESRLVNSQPLSADPSSSPITFILTAFHVAILRDPPLSLFSFGFCCSEGNHFFFFSALRTLLLGCGHTNSVKVQENM